MSEPIRPARLARIETYAAYAVQNGNSQVDRDALDLCAALRQAWAERDAALARMAEVESKKHHWHCSTPGCSATQSGEWWDSPEGWVRIRTHQSGPWTPDRVLCPACAAAEREAP